ncbi:hypothetical protein [Bacillus toyonensis]|uniref:hypothetical protein n=1 Tax=Bacillus toyonensis TaxID=155322 RepID=UPI000A19D863|nr:hypothetical protein [Bacillus toyonensis]MCU4770178.1 hypothetical protein [Bacillus toyonensis]MED2710624.1 hypothetical protein [Bacillus toyonensis]MED2742066.1 hypothetical protein [Bacillus toyonensis]OSM10411.1 hypothetical protein BTH38_25525 [Bacillus toyonensis]PEK40249.1 hypothetical protein CN592_30805 [Bacillus toyonensis]
MTLFKKFLIVVLISAIMCAAIWMVTYGALYETIGEFPSLISRTIFHTMFMTFSYTIIIGIYYLIKGFINLLLKKSAKDHFVFSGLLMLMAVIIVGISPEKEPMNRLESNEQIVEDNEALQNTIKTLETENKDLDTQVKKLEEELTKQNQSKTEEPPSTQVTPHEKPNGSIPSSTNEPKKNSADYDKNGNYKPVDQMKPEEIKKELEGMLEESLTR